MDESTPPSQTGYVLVVDDDNNSRASMVTLLDVEKIPVLEAPNGKRALELLDEYSGQIDLILLDLMMPQMDGFDFRDLQLDDPRLADVPCVVISGASYVPEVADALEAVDFLEKPTEVQDVLAVVRRHLSQATAAPEKSS